MGLVADPAGAAAGEIKAVEEINRWIGLSLTVAAAVALAQLLFEIRRLRIGRSRSNPSADGMPA